MVRRATAVGVLVAGGVLAITLPLVLGMPAWVPFVAGVVAFVGLGAMYDRTVHGPSDEQRVVERHPSSLRGQGCEGSDRDEEDDSPRRH